MLVVEVVNREDEVPVLSAAPAPELAPRAGTNASAGDDSCITTSALAEGFGRSTLSSASMSITSRGAASVQRHSEMSKK